MILRKRAVPLGALCLLATGCLLLRPLARFWSENENYRYGWGVPLLAAYLFYERWRCRPEPAPQRGLRAIFLGLIVAFFALVALGLRLVIETEPASRPLLWGVGCLFASALLAWVGILGGRPWVRHFAFPLLFLLVGVPWIFRCEFFVVQDLMRFNAEAVATALTILDFPARAAGNTIILPRGQLGVTEACSGIRSLQAALMMALFFGEFYRYSGRGRMGLVAAGGALALLGNFARMLYLAWRGAMHGVATVEAEHDSTGWMILVFTVAGLWIICLGTLRAAPCVRPSGTCVEALPQNGRAFTWALAVLISALFAEGVTQGWYGWREQSAPRYPSWNVSWPASQAATLAHDELEKLHAAAASQSSWGDTAGWRWTGLWIRYRAGAEGKVVFESHNPGLCLPAAGWRPLPGGSSFEVAKDDIQIEVSGSSFATGGRTVHVFWIPYLDGGVRAGADQGRGLFGHALAALEGGRLPWLGDVWAGCRRADAETLEVAVCGPADYAEAANAFRQMLPHMVRPDASAPTALAAKNY